MSWNYRVIKRDHPVQDWWIKKTEDGECGVGHIETTYAIHEVYYKGGNIVAISADPIHPIGDTFEELRGELRRMFIDALGKPVLDYDHIEFGDWDDDGCDYDTDDEIDTQDHLWSNRDGYDSH